MKLCKEKKKIRNEVERVEMRRKVNSARNCRNFGSYLNRINKSFIETSVRGF